MSDLRLTVIIPTRDRCDVLEAALRTVTDQDYDALEILVSDNCSTDSTESLVRSIDDPRIRYVNTGRRLSMSHNWEFALAHVKGSGWVTVVGDDDGLVPGALDRVADLVKETKAQAVRTSTCAYYWPSVTHRESGRLVVPTRTGYEFRNSQEFIGKVMSGAVRYLELPVLYTGGYVDVALVEKLRERGGLFYRSRIPDVYSGMAIASVIERYVYSNDNSAIVGASSHSTGFSQFSTKLSVQPPGTAARAFDAEDNIAFHAALPLSADGAMPGSLSVTVYESYLQSEFLRTGPPLTDHQYQLELMLATSQMDGPDTDRWAHAFAEMHQLDLDRARQRSRVLQATLLLRTLPHRVGNGLHRFDLGSTSDAITDVHQAAVTAATVNDDPPGVLRRAMRLVEAVWAKIVGRL